MSSLIDNLNDLKSSPKKSAKQVIATELYESFLTRKFLTINELAKKCFVSESTITGFCKRQGFSGYRELLFRLKLTREEYSSSKLNQTSNGLSSFANLEESVISVLQKTDVYYKDLLNIAETLKKATKVYIFSSFQLDKGASMMHDVLSSKLDNVTYNSIKIYSLDHLLKMKSTDAAIFFIAGQDTKSLDYLYLNAIKKTNNIVIFSSFSQSHKYKTFMNKIVIDLEPLPRIPTMRLMMINYFIALISLKVK
ncbi:hypothetical protein NPX79_02510 [Spiroplasma endosymbiont of Anurida maritima]|uniref:MurR/RpiR family transcriptional regulator n=1 Tax=Spiroplasma endosymbiont of Anurida maritima TaxID=2967972 RepID=UPI0036D40937